MKARHALLTLVVWTVLCLGQTRAADPRDSQREWWIYSGDYAGTKYSALRQINRENVQQLKLAWEYRTGDARSGRLSTIECNPIIVRGVMYLSTAGLKVVALDAASGKPLWVFDPFEGRGARGVNRGVTYWEQGRDKRIFMVAANHLLALNANTGQLIPGFGQQGRVDLRENLDRDSFFLPITASSPGIIYRDLLILGSAVGEGPGPAAPGHIRAFDVRTGQRRWIFHTIPYPGEPGYETWPPNAWKTAGGANNWSGLTLDLKRGLVFCGTGSPTYDHFGGNRAGQNLFGNCVLALEAGTGRLKWHFQTVHHDLWDYDVACPPNLVTVRHRGKTIDAVAQAGKLGHMFLLHRETGHPLFPVEERPVPQSELPGEHTWPSQPFPTRPPPYAQQRFTADEVTDLNPAAREAVLTKLKTMRTGDIFLPPGLQPAVTLPQFNGGTDWGGAAFDPKTRRLIVNCSNEAEWLSMTPTTPKAEMKLGELGQLLYGAICSTCHGTGQSLNPTSPPPASLTGVRDRLSKQDVLTLLEIGKGQMPSFPNFTAIEKKALISYLWDEGRDEIVATKDLNLSFAQETPFLGTGHHEFRDPDGFPANKRPWGTLSAIDLDEGTIVWQTPLGTYPALEAKGYPPTGTFNMGGPIVTAGGLIFIGGSMDERFHAYDKETGKLLWEYQMAAGGYATPATYEIDGRQYVVIAAGGGGKPETRSGDTFHCFALPKR